MSNSQVTKPTTTLGADDLSRHATIVHANDAGLTHLGVMSNSASHMVRADTWLHRAPLVTW